MEEVIEESLDHVDILAGKMARINHPSSDTADELQNTLKWFNTLKPNQKSDCFLYLMGRALR